MSQEFQPSDPTRFRAALDRFDQENSADPNKVELSGEQVARELAYARWLTGWVLRLSPDASEELRLAARCQHLCRWKVPRESYPMTRAGYLKWREGLKQFHAEQAGRILGELGYSPQVITRVQDLNLKRNLGREVEVQVLEDALCLVFLEHQFGDLAHKTAEDKTINALRKSWNKMSPQAREFALSLSYDPLEKTLLEKALSFGGVA
jgi:hypothetical protein